MDLFRNLEECKFENIATDAGVSCQRAKFTQARDIGHEIAPPKFSEFRNLRKFKCAGLVEKSQPMRFCPGARAIIVNSGGG